jgi:hypothetical protein
MGIPTSAKGSWRPDLCFSHVINVELEMVLGLDSRRAIGSQINVWLFAIQDFIPFF